MADATIREQLGKVGRSSKSLHNKVPVMPALSRYKKDGEDHINIWEKAETPLGRFLAHGTNTPFHHPVFGMFNNVECFWHYIRSEERDDRIRTMSNVSGKKFSENFTSVKVPNFYAVIMDTNWVKLKEYPDKMLALKENELPLEMYYLYKNSGAAIRPMFAVWVLQGFEEIQRALKEDRNPDFTSLMNIPGQDLYGPLLNKNSVAAEE